MIVKEVVIKKKMENCTSEMFGIGKANFQLEYSPNESVCKEIIL